MREASLLLATILTGIVTGFYLSHSLVLGPMFSWLSDPTRLPLLQQTYAEFRILHPPWLYLAVIELQQAAVVAFAALSARDRRHVLAAVAAAVCTLVVPAVHVVSGFFRLEVEVVSGVLHEPADLARFAAWNVPIHVFHTLATFAAFVILCRIRIREGRRVSA